MPKTSSDSVKKKSEPKAKVVTELTRWAEKTASGCPEIKKIGYFGSYARGDYTPSSDLDIIMIIKRSNKVFFKRADDYPVDNISAGCEVFVFTEEEIKKRVHRYRNGWLDTILGETVWIYEKKGGRPLRTALLFLYSITTGKQ
jgi:predicted nucleotidyltransferase